MLWEIRGAPGTASRFLGIQASRESRVGVPSLPAFGYALANRDYDMLGTPSFISSFAQWQELRVSVSVASPDAKPVLRQLLIRNRCLPCVGERGNPSGCGPYMASCATPPCSASFFAYSPPSTRLSERVPNLPSRTSPSASNSPPSAGLQIVEQLGIARRRAVHRLHLQVVEAGVVVAAGQIHPAGA